MSKSINWQTLSEKERVRLVLENVMGCFVSDETAEGWCVPDFLKDVYAPAGFHWPIAFWNTDAECWMTKDTATDSTPFDPLHDMNDTWNIVERMHLSHRSLHVDATVEDLTEADYFLVHLWELVGKRGMDAIFAYTSENICIAALKAVGMEIEA